MAVDAEVADLLMAKELRGERLEVMKKQEIARSVVAGDWSVASREYM